MELWCPVVATSLLFLILVITCSGYYVKSTSNTMCPVEPCLTLSEYEQQPYQYLTPNLTLLLLPRDHVLSVNFIVENIRAVEICAQLFSPTNNHPKSRVVCKGLVGFTFRNVSTMVLDGLTFKSCGRNTVENDAITAHMTFTTYGMSVISGKDVNIVNCSFKDSVGTALGVFNSSLHLYGNSFTNNCNGQSSMSHGSGTGFFTNINTMYLIGNETFRNNSAEYGGGITPEKSSLHITENVAFRRNNRGKYGGGIYAYNSTLNFTGNSIFRENSAEYGGGISASNSIINFTGNSSFTDNAAKQYGGGIHVVNCTLISSANSAFRDNSAGYLGGAINADDSSLNFTGNNTFRSNSAENGGGISVYNCTLFHTGNCSFGNNSARDFGGGIGLYNSTLYFMGSSFFTNNSAIQGGGIDAFNSNLTSTGSNFFRINSAEYGGGIYAIKSTLSFIGSSIFGNNSAMFSGGGIDATDSSMIFTGIYHCINNSARDFGGGIGLCNSTLYFMGNSFFTSNSAIQGGGIHAFNSNLTSTGSNFFRINSAEYGGGIYAFKCTLSFIGSSIFGNNSAVSNGGGVDAKSSTLISTGSSTFEDNLARDFGGGINALYSTLNFTGNDTFRGNSAEWGGGIDADNSTLIYTGNSRFRDNSARQTGGGIVATYSTLNFTGNNTFRGNSAYLEHGGGISVWHDSILNFTGNNIFIDNSAMWFGGGIFADVNSTLKLTGNNTFRDNSAEYGGGISVDDCILNLTGNSIFTNNKAVRGGGIDTLNSNLDFTGNKTFRINLAKIGGGIHVENSTLSLTGNSTFGTNNATRIGAGFNTFSSTLNFNGNTRFINNSAELGGGIGVLDSTLNVTGMIAFRENNAEYHGGSIYASKSTLNIVACGVDTKFRDYGNCSSYTLLFMNNSAKIIGGAVFSSDSNLIFKGCNIFTSNSVKYYGGGVHSQNSSLKFMGNTKFSSNFVQYNGGGIDGFGTSLYLSGIGSFTANTAGKGGAVYLAGSFIFLSRNTTVIMNNNSATEYGGAVYVDDSNPITYCTSDKIVFDKCFLETYELFEIPHLTYLNLQYYAVTAYYNIYIHFYNNHAEIAGSAVYGGSMDICRIRVDYKSTNRTSCEFLIMNDLLNIELEANSVSSHPYQVCPCEDGTPSCNTSELHREVYPGELLQIPVVAVGQKNGVIPAVIRAYFVDTNGNSLLAQFQDTQEAKKNCTELYYQVHSSISNNSDTLVLYADGRCSTAGKVLKVSLHFLPCPTGFSFNYSDGTCGCEPWLHKYTTRCNITERTLRRDGEFWVGYDNDYDRIILHPHCPFDYCKPAKYHISLPLNNTDLQCENNRSGILCGECKSGLSLVFGSSKCLKCTNIHQLLLIPFAMAGVALVLLLLICKLTVAAGTINGLIFYANIVTVNRAIFLPPNQTNILTVFTSWVNLDLGFEACFFDGMDKYIKTWLQFIFPLYVCGLIVLIIIASEYSSRISRLFGSNPVAVLATLFLLSYGKLLHTVITAMFFTTLDYSDEVKAGVWLCDGNIRYLHGKHIALFLVSLLTILIFLLPYTLLLTVGQWLQANSNQRFFHWINKPRIKPFFDAYQAPYRDQHRYWTGLLLCLRCALFLVFAFNTQADPSINLLAISSVAFGLTLVTRYTGAVYRKLHVDILEASFILNIGILAIATYYLKHAVVQVDQAAVAYTSVGIAFATFIGVVLYHTYHQIWPRLKQRIHRLCDHQDKNCSNSEEERNATIETPMLAAPTTTIVDRPCPESLDIDDGRSRSLFTPYTNFIELREPLELFDPYTVKIESSI